MKSHLLSASLVGFLFMVAGCTRTPIEPAAKTPTKAEDEAAIKAVYEKEVAAYQARDAAAMAALQTVDALLMLADQPTAVGREAIKSSRQAGFDWIAKELSAGSLAETVHEIEVAGDWAFARGTFTFTGTRKARGKPIKDVGKFIDILRRQPDGSWQMSRCCWNRDTPDPFAAK